MHTYEFIATINVSKDGTFPFSHANCTDSMTDSHEVLYSYTKLIWLHGCNH